MRSRSASTSRLFAWLVAGVIAVAMVATAAPAVAQDPQPCGLAGEGDDPGEDGFQIDGQFYSGEYADPGNDWAQGGAFAGVIQNDGTADPAFEPALHDRDPHWAGSAVDPTTFKGHSNKNNDDISEGENPWAWGSGNGPQKNDLTDVYAHATVYDVGGSPEVWLFLGALTRATNGDSHIDFEWNIAGLDQRDDPKPLGKRIYGLGPDAGRTADIDFIVSVDFVQGGEIPMVTYRRWRETSPGDFEYEEFTPDPGEVYVCTNVVDVPAPPWGAVAPNGDPSTTVEALQFVEMAVNLTDQGVTPEDLCSSLSTMLFKTRSSQSFTAELKDYALHRFPIVPGPECVLDPPCAPPDCNSGGNGLCGPDLGVGFTYLWELISAPDGWEILTPLDRRCISYYAGDPGEATFRLTVTDESGCSGYCEAVIACQESRSKMLPGQDGESARPEVPMAFALSVSTPNPTREGTAVRYAVPMESRVRLTIHNLRGQVVAVLEDGVVGAGHHTKHWGTETGAAVASGVYFLRMEATGVETGETFRQTQKLTVIR